MVEWTVLDMASMTQLRDFLDRHKGAYAFLWTLPVEGKAVQVKCKNGATVSVEGFENHTVSATFTEDFGL